MEEDRARRRLCTHLGLGVREILERLAVPHSAWEHKVGPPPSTPVLPHGDLWSLVNHVKVMQQYTELLSEAAAGRGPHAPLLSGSAAMCVGPLQWFAPLCQDAVVRGEEAEEYYRHVGVWRRANPGLFGDAEAAYHAHLEQGGDRGMTRYLVSLLDGAHKEYEVDIAAGMLRAGPGSFDEFQRDFSCWRDAGLYHPLCLAARHMPRAEQWVPEGLDTGPWQDLLDGLNRAGHCSGARLEAVCEALEHHPALGNHLCALLDRVAILTRVKSNGGALGLGLDDYLPLLRFPKDPSPYMHCLKVWGRLKHALQAVPPSLLCPAVYPPSRGTWGYERLRLAQAGSLRIEPGPLTWIDKDVLGPKEPITSPQERLYDILFRLGEAATSPEVAHLMLDPQSLRACLRGEAAACPDLSDRRHVVQRMDKEHCSEADFRACLAQLLQCLPGTTERSLGAPRQLLAWRVDIPPRVILYHGGEGRLDLAACPPHTLHKSIGADRVAHKTVSGIAVLDAPTLDAGGIHDALRACIAKGVVGPHADFANHPHHKCTLRAVPHPLHTTTLAEAVTLFTGPLPEKLSDVPLHASAPWTEGHIDTRYAERQTGDNGSRVRDWAAVYMDHEEIQRCRLAAHEIRCGTVHETHFPLASPSGHSWVEVVSTLPTETRVLRHAGGRGGLEALRRSVEGRFMHDPKLLPLAHPDDSVLRSSMEVYSDEPTGRVLLAYAPVSPDGTKRALEFMSFRHAV